jgi:hypothetical protein
LKVKLNVALLLDHRRVKVGVRGLHWLSKTKKMTNEERSAFVSLEKSGRLNPELLQIAELYFQRNDIDYLSPKAYCDWDITYVNGGARQTISLSIDGLRFDFKFFPPDDMNKGHYWATPPDLPRRRRRAETN